MDANAFIAEVYSRMSARHAAESVRPRWSEMRQHPVVAAAENQYSPYLPKDRTAPILDIGFGSGWFVAACLNLGYQKIFAADFGIEHKSYIRDWAPDSITLFDIRSDVGEFLSDKPERFEFIHLSHVLEHVPKYSLLWFMDSLYWALRPGGSVLIRTPNMEGPCPNSSLYVTLSHEYGFAGANLISLLDICGFDEVKLLDFREPAPTLKRRVGDLLRWSIVKQNHLRHRLFGVNHGGQFGPELIVSGKRGAWPPYFDRRFK